MAPPVLSEFDRKVIEVQKMITRLELYGPTENTEVLRLLLEMVLELRAEARFSTLVRG